MKKVLCFALSAALAITMGTGSLMPVKVSAAQKTSGQEVTKPLQLSKKKNKEEYREGEALVLFKSSAAADTRTRAKKALGMGDALEVSQVWDFDSQGDDQETAGKGSMSKKKASSARELSIALVKSDTLTTKQLIRKLKAKENVEIAEPNYRLHALSTVNDTYFKKQWGLENTGQNGGILGKSVNIASKWDKGIKGSEKVVAIVDTGVDYTHEDLKDNIWENTYQPDLKGEHGFDFINGDDDPFDDNGHGSHCAGIIGARGNNGIGISGVNQNVKIMALKMLDAWGGGYGSDEVGAYHYINKALDLGVNIVAINNSWGGGENSKIFEKLMELVGEKGAVSVCAAGNSSENSDEYGEYPSNIESLYKLSVAASNGKGQLAAFSNYGKNTVDLAAPGTDILSTVSYDCYNPTLYSESKQKEVSQEFNDFEGSGQWGIPAGFTSNNDDAAENYSAEISSEEYFGENTSGKSLKLSFKNMKRGECASMRIPYTLSQGLKDEELPVFSAQVKVKNESGTSSSSNEYNISTLAIMDMPVGIEVKDLEDVLFDYPVTGIDVEGETNYWSHLNLTCGEDEDNPAEERELVLVFATEKAGSYDIYLDDIGLSKEKADTSQFGKYDFYNGTSMAAPFVTGAIALAAAEYPDSDSEQRVQQVLSSVQVEDELSGKVVTGGILDFSRVSAAGPRIGEISVNPSKKQISITGSGFDSPDLKVTIDGKEAKILEKSGKKVTIKDEGWINTYVEAIVVEGNGGKTAKKEKLYLVNGKASYSAVKDISFPSAETGLATDGRLIFCADSDSDEILAADTAKKKARDFDTVCKVKASKFFKKDKSSSAEFDFTFGKDLIYMDGKLYNIAAYSQVHNSFGGIDDDDDDWDFFDDEEEMEESSSVAYSSQYKLLCMDPKTGKTVSLGVLPSSVKRTEDWTLAGYNGKLYLIGGFDYSKKTLSKAVKIYNPTTKKWSAGPSLPEGRAAGKAIQTGKSLVYTLGYGEGQKGKDSEKQECPKNLILTGKTWKTSKKTLNFYNVSNTVKRSGDTYVLYKGSIGLCAGGIVYAGAPAAGLGDTFTYNVSKDNFTATKYNKIKNLKGSERFTGIAVGNTLYGGDQNGETYSAKISSGLVKVSAAKMKHGSIVGANKSYVPGTAVTLKATPKKGYGVKAFKVNGKSVSGTVKKIRVTSNIKASASFGTAVSQIKLNKKTVTVKAGKTFKLKATVLPSKAANKKVIYKSSNNKYAEVSAKGVVKTKKAGKGKTVTITVKAQDGSKKAAKCKVKIL